MSHARFNRSLTTAAISREHNPSRESSIEHVIHSYSERDIQLEVFRGELLCFVGIVQHSCFSHLAICGTMYVHVGGRPLP